MKKIIFNPVFILLFMENFFFFSSRNSLNLLPPYLSSLRASEGYIGFYMNISSLMLVVFVVFFTVQAQRFNKRALLLAGFTLQLLSLVFSFLYPKNLLLLILLQFIGSFSYAFGYIINSALAFDIIPPEKRTGGIAIYGLSGVLAAPAGSYLGEAVSGILNQKYLFLLSILFCLSAMISVFFLEIWKDPGETRSVSFWQIIKKKELAVLFFLGLSIGGAWSVLATFIPNFTLERLGIINLSAYFTVNSAIAIMSRTVFARIIDNTPKKYLIMTASVLVIMAMTMTAFLSRTWQLYCIGAFYGLGHSILYPVLNAAVVDSGEAHEKFSLSSAFVAVYTLGNVLLSTLLGMLGDILGTVSIFISMALLFAVSIPLASVFIKKRL